MGITQVVRGRDLLPSTPRQIAVLEALGYAVPQYAHIPLLLDAEHERLAKRHASLSLESLRQDGVSPWRIIGLLAWVAGITDRREPVHPRELVSSFRWESLPRDDYGLTSKDMQWLGKENMNVC